jgi:hypothetical protein
MTLGGHDMKYLFLAALVIPVASWSKTYNFADRLGIGGGGGYTFPIQGNDFDDFAKDEVMWNGHIRYHFTPEDSLQLNYSHLEFENTDINARVMDSCRCRRHGKYFAISRWA